MINGKTSASIVWTNLLPLIDRLAEDAKDEVTANFCRQRCGHGPEVNFCPAAHRQIEQRLSRLFKEHVRLN